MIGTVRCRYCTDADGKLMYCNTYPNAVEKMYEVKILISEADIWDDALEELILELEYRLFKSKGVFFTAWLAENRARLFMEIESIGRHFADSENNEEQKGAMWRILSGIKNIINM